MKEFKGAPALDARLVSAAQAVEHYEIARYGTPKRWAEQLGFNEAMGPLDATLSEERNTDEGLTELATNEQAEAARGGTLCNGKRLPGNWEAAVLNPAG
jgi:ferritin-like metal-binding protein YciE